jgi:uncharacterized membrane protein HdeD (DUF308 family)/nucleotide-binding universal stress UspA family protein
MSAVAQHPIADMLAEGATQVRKNWGWVLALGIVQIIVGAFAVCFAFSATLASVVTLGILLLIAAGAQTAAAIWARDWKGFFLFLLVGVLYAVTGFLMLQNPLLAAEGLTLMLAAAFLVGGVFRIVVAVAERFPSWGWVLCNGIVTVLLGIAIIREWPASGLWVLGMFVGIDLIVNGATGSVVAVGVRNGLARLTGREFCLHAFQLQESTMLQVKTLLHPTDLTDASRHAFDLTCQIARDRGARIVAMHVVPPPTRHSTEVVIGDPLADFRERAPGVPIDTRVEKGDPAGVILRTAEEVKCDLIVMGTHGRAGLSHRITGNVADEVAQRAPCPVVTMRCPFPEELRHS